jgi:hypothetical protein
MFFLKQTLRTLLYRSRGKSNVLNKIAFQLEMAASIQPEEQLQHDTQELMELVLFINIKQRLRTAQSPYCSLYNRNEG